MKVTAPLAGFTAYVPWPAMVTEVFQTLSAGSCRRTVPGTSGTAALPAVSLPSSATVTGTS